MRAKFKLGRPSGRSTSQSVLTELKIEDLSLKFERQVINRQPTISDRSDGQVHDVVHLGNFAGDERLAVTDANHQAKMARE